MSLPDVTVVVPAYRRPERLRTCLEALAAQDHPASSLEVVVVDDGSPVPLAELAPEFSDRLRLTIHRQANAGPAAARNEGARRASGSLLAFTDDDCTPATGWVRGLAVAHRRSPEALLGGPVVNALASQRCAEASQLLVAFLYEWFTENHPSRFFASNNLAVPRDAFLASGGFDESFPRPGGEDRELCERWRRSGRSLVGVPDAVVHHAHAMGLRGFVRQHWNYGRGAHDLHRRRQATGGRLRVEPPRFYTELVRYPFRHHRFPAAVPLAGLMVVSQAATAAGFAWELRTRSRPTASRRLRGRP